MIVSVLSYKGGVGKTTTAIHLAGALQERGNTLLVDGDLNRQGMEWGRAGRLPFSVVDEAGAKGMLKRFAHVVIDTPARPGPAEIAELARNSDLVIIPTTPSTPSMKALLKTWQALKTASSGKVRVLITIVPPRPSRVGDEARAGMVQAGLPVMDAQIRRLSCFERAADLGVLVKDVADPRAAMAWDDYVRVGWEALTSVPGVPYGTQELVA